MRFLPAAKVGSEPPGKESEKSALRFADNYAPKAHNWNCDYKSRIRRLCLAREVAGPYPKRPTPPTPPCGFDENKGVSRKYFSRPKKTNNLQKVENREPEETRQKPNKEFSFQALFAESFLPGIAFTAHCSGAVQVSLTAAIGTPYN